MINTILTARAVCEKFGISARRLHFLRENLVSGVDFERVEGCIHYTPAGVAKLHGLIHASLSEESRPTAPPSAPVPIVELKFVRYTLNRNIILASDGTNIRRVRARYSSFWLPGMPVHATHISQDLYEMHGALPRARGKTVKVEAGPPL